MYNVIIVDDQKTSQDFMKYHVDRGINKYTLTGVFSDADDVLSASLKDVDLVLLDIFTGDKENGLKVGKYIKENYPNIKIIVLTFLVQQKHIDEAKKIGCEGFWYKDYTEGDLLEIMDKIMAGEKHYPNDVPIVTIGMAKSSDFTRREIEVLQLKADGMSNAEVCSRMNIGTSTLNGYISSLKEKTGYDSMIKLLVDLTSKKFIISDINQEKEE